MIELAAQLAHASRLLQQGRAQAAVEHGRTLLRDYPDQPEVLRCVGLGLLQQRQFLEAEDYLSRALRLAPDSPNLLNDLGVVRLRQHAYRETVNLLTRALEIDPTHRDALNNLAATFTLLGQPARAKDYLEWLVRVMPFSAQACLESANNALALNELERAIGCGRKAVRLASHDSAARLSLADSLEATGRFRQAKFQYLAVLARDPDQVIALSKLLSLRGTHVRERHELHAQQLLVGKELSEPQRTRLHMGLAKYYDSRGRYDSAFEHIRTANAAKHSQHPFDSNLFTRSVDELIDTFSAESLRSLPVPEAHSGRPVFIVGMPRSGTTLVEQILASHSRIAAGGELSTLINVVAQIGRQTGKAYPAAVRDLDASALGRMGQQYLDKLESISQDALRVTDKMPFNFLHLGLIAALFPDAKIIHCRRDPLDTCLSCYFTTFSEQLQFASDLGALGRYYLDYRRMMEHWRTVLTVPMLEVQYEELVSDSDGTVRRLLEYCGVEWEPGCTRFYETARGVRTPSRWQVRQPIYRSSVGRWRRYEQHLAPLLETLSPVLRENAQPTPQS